jgi:hypothetical protein
MKRGVAIITKDGVEFKQIPKKRAAKTRDFSSKKKLLMN